jgi:hypothetical protein
MVWIFRKALSAPAVEQFGICAWAAAQASRPAIINAKNCLMGTLVVFREDYKAVDSEEWTVNSGQWTVDSEQWTVNSEQWTVDSGQ